MSSHFDQLIILYEIILLENNVHDKLYESLTVKVFTTEYGCILPRKAKRQ